MANKRDSDAKKGATGFVASVAAPGEFSAGAPEIAFVGRSNVGKSSLLNALAKRRKLARTSKTPGRTQRANLFDLRIAGQDVRFVDLPGYGHANAPQHVRASFGPLIERWLLDSERLAMAAILVDARRDPSDSTMNFLLWLRQHNVPAEVVFTKVDKVARNRRLQRLKKLAKAYDVRTFHSTSSLKGEGIAALRTYIGEIAGRFDEAAE